MEHPQWMKNLYNVIKTQVEANDGAALVSLAGAPNEEGKRPCVAAWVKGESAGTKERAQLFVALFSSICEQNDVDPLEILKEMRKIIKNGKVTKVEEDE